MSFSFSNKFSVRKDGGGGGGGPQTDPVTGQPVAGSAADVAAKRKTAAKQNPLLNAKTDDYADDNLLYNARMTRKERIKYFTRLQELNPQRKDSEYAVQLEEIRFYPKRHVWLFGFIRNNRWDQWYMNLFIIWMMLLIALVDGWAKAYAPMLISLNANNNNLLLLPPVFMLICQLIPLFGIIFYMHYGYDLVHFLAAYEFQSWSFVTCLLAQYIEYFHYGGRDKRDEAGVIRIGSVNKPSKIRAFLMHYVKRIAAKGAKIYAGDDSSSEGGEEGEGEDDEDDEEDEDGNKDVKKKKVVRIQVKSSEDVEAGAMSPKTRPMSPPPNPPSRPSSANPTRPSAELALVVGSSLEEGKEEVVIEENPEDYMDWTCLVCNTPNHGLKHNPNPDVEIYFGEKGILYKRMYANLVFQTTKPRCKKCYTVFDYVPPPGSAHLFPHNPNPHVAFTVYPKPTRVQNGLNDKKSSIYYNYFLSFLFGMKNNFKSMPTLNDWRLKKYVRDHFPKIPKYALKPGEQYRLGEIVECRLQKSEYFRAKIVFVNTNNTYNVRFDQGDELRFVQPQDLRLGTEKRAFSYRVELGLVIMVVSFPICLILAIMSGSISVAFLGVMLVSLGMFATRVKIFLQYAVNYYQAGICVIARLSAFYTLPVFFFFLTTVIGISSADDPASWSSIAALAILMKFFALPVFYAQRPFYAIMACTIFLQTSIGLILLSMWFAAPEGKRGYLAIPLGPFLTTTLTLKYYRRQLHNIWDTCLVIRPASETGKNNPSLFWTCWTYINKGINYLKIQLGY